MSLAVALALGTALALPAVAFADADDSDNLMRKKRFGQNTGTVTTNSNTGGHSQESGSKATTETAVISDGAITPFITADGAAAMQAVADKYAAVVAQGGWPKVPSGKLKKGSTGKGPAALNKRLFMEGYLRAEATEGEYAQVFTSATEDALRRFQRNHGLSVTGVIDGPTLGALNVPADRRLATIKANIPRLAEYSKDIGNRYIVVNIPAQQIEAVNDGKVYSLHNAIVGRPSRPTPVVMTPLTVIRFNPYWNAPASIVEKDIVPRMTSSGASKVMRDMNMKIFNGVGGPEIDPDSVNWRRAVVDNYHFRQEPGGSNAMATAKIEFNSPFGIYLHDTPEPHLFHTGSRFYSSGCVRVDKVAILIDWILQGQDGINSSRIAELAETKERLDKPVTNSPQLRVAYLTSWPTRDGVAAFRSDVYQLDGTGFVVGQPLPVGETQGGKRYVLKPIPRSLEAVDADEAVGFASIFRRSSDRIDASERLPGASSKSTDSLVSLKDPKAKLKAQGRDTGKKKSKAASNGKTRAWTGNRERSASEVMSMPDADGTTAKKPGSKKVASKKAKSGDKSKTAKAKADEKAKTTKSTKVVKKDKTEVAAKKPDAKAVTDKKKALTDATKTASADSKSATQKSNTAKAAKPADCKAGADGKLPAGCKPAAAAKKPPAKPEKTAATPAKTASSTN
ncbi:L,D-transpeptidase family protein [Aestuariivirga sp.]|uniref:L,D-transpeptidase family protein n=1 Tax=Aestuariivirga sp. TaxID=2650926 RepID=UPI0035935DB6